MFGGISARYDLLNRLITFGRDRAWRRHVLERATLPPGGRLLDIGAGTGGVAFEALRLNPTLHVIAADYTIQMIAMGRRKASTDKICWCNADALHLPFPHAVFDSVASAYLIRNVTSAEQAFKEQMRVTKPGGRVVCLDTSPPSPNITRPFVVFYLRFVIPLLGQLIASDRAAYEYLPSSTQAFMTPDELASTMRNAGLEDLQYERFMFGTQVIATGIRP
jgi:demethylmenaquinone methyltransferase/2-methoxy-6-polyprenyl-1,4-benzoquinol methylase